VRLGPPPAYDPQANVLLFVEMGRGPGKYAAGRHGEQLKFNAGQSRATAAVLKAGGVLVRAPAYDDLSYQATTRGGRVMDHVLANKAVFKDATSGVGDAALVTGAILAGHQRRHHAGCRHARLGQPAQPARLRGRAHGARHLFRPGRVHRRRRGRGRVARHLLRGRAGPRHRPFRQRQKLIPPPS
jgi:hypothetical protein